MLGVVYALAVASGIAAAVAIYVTYTVIVMKPAPVCSQGALQGPADGGRGSDRRELPSLDDQRAESVPLFQIDPLDDDMVLPAAWPAHNVTDMNGRPYFVGRPS